MKTKSRVFFMKRITLFAPGCLFLFATIAIGGSSGKRVALSDDVEVMRLTEHVRLHTTYHDLESIGRCPANGLVVIDGGQAIVIDSPWTNEQMGVLFDWIEREQHAKVTWVVPTHSHIDCAGGLAEAHRRGAESIALDKTAEILKREGDPLPQKRFTGKERLTCSGRQVEIAFFGAGHTVDNIVAWLPEEKILFGGCMVKSMGARGMGYTAEADLDAWPGTLRAVETAYPEAQCVVPGHGSPGSLELIDHTIALLHEFKRRDSKAGKDSSAPNGKQGGDSSPAEAQKNDAGIPEEDTSVKGDAHTASRSQDDDPSGTATQEANSDMEKPAFYILPDALVQRATLIRERALKSTGAYEFLKELTTRIGPRLSGTENDRLAVEWALAKLKESGFVNVHAEEVMVSHWQRGTAIGRIVSPLEREFTPLALGGSVATPAGGIEAEVIEVGGGDALAELKPSQVSGKIVFFNRKMERSRDGHAYGQVSPDRRHGPAKAAALGAIAAIVRSVSPSTTAQAHTGMTLYEPGVPKIPAVTLSNPEADVLEAMLKQHGTVRFHLELDCKYLEDVSSANVMGEVRGREKSEEIVLICAHLDSWDVGTGAQDDGAGCAVITEVGRLIKRLDPAPYRTLRVWFATNEEFGLAGGLDYARKYADEADRYVAAFEVDAGTGRVWGMQSRVSFWTRMTVGEIAKLLEPLGVEYLGNDTLGGTDLLPMMRYRIPLFTLNHDMTEYFDVYHSANDTLDKVDPPSLAQNVAAYAVLALAALDFEPGFGRAPEFRGKLPPPLDGILEGKAMYR